ncbi:MAG: acyltransferase [Dermatophilus congolensis]|nr:acyltransferase [Dermatophilus congolensis]
MASSTPAPPAVPPIDPPVGDSRSVQRRRRAEHHRDIGATLDPRCNGLNLLRLIMASGVIWYHTFRLTGRPIAPPALDQALTNVWVDGFFVLSGYLIVGSWMRRPRLATYTRHRLLRLYPAFFVCLFVTAFVAAPLGAVMQNEQVTFGEQISYVGQNLGMFMRTFAVGDTLASVPYPGVWNGSLWTLFWELLCYIAVVVLGVAGVLRSRFGIPVAFGVAWVFALVAHLTPVADIHVPLVLYRYGSLPLGDAARFGLVFAAGALVWHLREVLVAGWGRVAASFAVVAASMWLPDYRLLAAPFLAYGLVALGALIKIPWLHLRNDISYGMYIYAFPIQQLLVAAGLAALGVWQFALLATVLTVLPATLSWFCVEKPAMRFK